MINSITPAITTKSQAIRKNNQQSFDMAYRIDNRWNETFDSMKEKDFILGLIKKIKNGQVKYIGTDGVSQHFKGIDGDIYFTKETKQMMGNVKFVPRDPSDEGFYIIDNQKTNDGNYFQHLSKHISDIVPKIFRTPSETPRIHRHTAYHNINNRTNSKSIPISYYHTS